jgi:membrane AbrB-like protein
LTRHGYLRVAAALAIGAAGGSVFAYFRLPLPWMLGAMAACTTAALLRAPIRAPAPPVVVPMTMVVGVVLGTAFSPDTFGHARLWLAPLCGLVATVVLSALICITYFRHMVGFDVRTAYFAGMPGGLVEMVTLGQQSGADTRSIALVHSARILFVVFTLPFVFQVLSGVRIGAAPVAVAAHLDGATVLHSSAWLVLVAGAGACAGYILRLRAPFLLGPMLLSAIIHILDWSSFAAPPGVLNVAQWVLGTSIGCRFVGIPTREVLRVLAYSTGSTVILFAVTAGVAFATSRVARFGTIPLMLAYAPGGLTEMSLMAISLQMEVAFVAANHVLRVVMVTVGAALLLPLLTRGEAKPGSRK